MKNVIISVYFGSGDTLSMDRLDAALSGAFPDYEIRRAFLSRHIPGTPTLDRVLKELADHDRVLLQAMLVARGPTYDALLRQAGTLPVGGPLLDSAAALGAAMAQQFAPPLVLMAHGAAGLDLTEAADAMPDGVFLAAMEGQPSLASLFPRLAGKTVHLVPCLLTGGHHLAQDLTRWQQQLEEMGCTVLCHREPLAHAPQIGAMFVGHLQTILQEESSCE